MPRLPLLLLTFSVVFYWVISLTLLVKSPLPFAPPIKDGMRAEIDEQHRYSLIISRHIKLYVLFDATDYTVVCAEGEQYALKKSKHAWHAYSHSLFFYAFS